MPVLVTLPDGRTVDIDTAEAVNTLLQEGGKGMFTSTVKEIRKIRKKKKRLRERDKNKLHELHKFMDSVATKADPGLFRGNFAEAEIKCWLEYTIGEIKRFTKMNRWIQTGDLEYHDELVLYPCKTMFTHPIPVALVFESEFFEALTGFVKARKNSDGGRGMPTHQMCLLITSIICEAFVTATTRCDTNWSAEMTFKKFETYGVLEQFIRCITVPQPQEAMRAQQMLVPLHSCPRFLRKKFQQGEPCGDTLQAILDGNDGSQAQSPEAIQKLQRISRSVKAMETRAESGVDKLAGCGNCGNMDRSDGFQKALMKCARCKCICYCSKECQKTDWKRHQKMCRPGRIIPKITKNLAQSIQTDLHAFLNRHYNYMMIRMVEACESQGLKMKDMMVELDYVTNKDGSTPALQDPPIFKIVPFRDYGREGSQESDWLLKCKETNPNRYEALISNVKLLCSRPTPNTLMFVVNRYVGPVCDGQIDEKLNETALDAYRTAIKDGDFEPLSKILRSDILELAQVMISVGVNEVYEFLRNSKDPNSRMEFIATQLRTHFLEFSEKHYVAVMTDIVENQIGFKMQDMVIELDFEADMAGRMPGYGGGYANRFEYSNFNIIPFSKYADGSRPKEKDWFPDEKNRLAFEKKKSSVIALFQKKAKPSGKATVVVNYTGGVFLDPHIDYGIPYELFTEKNLKAFKSAIHDSNLKPLSKIFPKGLYGVYVMDLYLFDRIPKDAAMAAIPQAMLRAMHGGQMASDEELFGGW